MRTDLRDLRNGLLFCSPWLVGFSVFTLLPVVICARYSLSDYSATPQPRLFIGAGNYHDLLHDPLFRKSIANTLYYAAIALPAGMLVSLGLALMLNADIRGRAIYRTVIFLPSLVPTVATACVWLWLYNAKYGLINNLLRSIGIQGPAWIDDRHWAMPSLALMSLWGVGNTVVIYLAGLQDVPRDVLEAAEIDGATHWRRIWHVTIPMLSPVIFFNLIMAIITTLQVLTIPYIMTEGGPENATYFFTMAIYDNAFRYLHMGYASAMAWVQLVLILGLTGLAFWTSKRWVHYGGGG